NQSRKAPLPFRNFPQRKRRRRRRHGSPSKYLWLERARINFSLREARKNLRMPDHRPLPLLFVEILVTDDTGSPLRRDASRLLPQFHSPLADKSYENEYFYFSLIHRTYSLFDHRGLARFCLHGRSHAYKEHFDDLDVAWDEWTHSDRQQRDEPKFDR